MESLLKGVEFWKTLDNIKGSDQLPREFPIPTKYIRQLFEEAAKLRKLFNRTSRQHPNRSKFFDQYRKRMHLILSFYGEHYGFQLTPRSDNPKFSQFVPITIQSDSDHVVSDEQTSPYYSTNHFSSEEEEEESVYEPTSDYIMDITDNEQHESNEFIRPKSLSNIDERKDNLCASQSEQQYKEQRENSEQEQNKSLNLLELEDLLHIR